MTRWNFCPQCANPLEMLPMQEDSGIVERLRCAACGFTHWNNPTPVLAAIVEYRGQVLLARNAAWPAKMFALITGFMEAAETPQEGIAREVKEETNLDVQSTTLVGAYEFLRMNQIIIAYHVVATDGGSLRDFQAFAKQTGNELVEQQTVGEEFIHILRRR